MRLVNKFLILYIFVILLFCAEFISSNSTNNATPFASLEIKTNPGILRRPDICNYVIDFLKEINIEVKLKTEEWGIFFETLNTTYDFDLAFVGWSENDDAPDRRDIYNENGTQNISGMNKTIPYCQTSEDMQNEGLSIFYPSEQQQHYYEWQQLLMDKIVPILPFFSWQYENGTLFDGQEMLFFNMRRPFIGGEDNYIFLNKNGLEEYTKACAVRKAICYAIDREEINQEIHGGEYTISHSPYYLTQEFWYYNDIIKYNYDLEAALDWLDAAGYSLTEEEPMPILGIIAAIGVGATLLYYRRKRT